MTKRAVITGIGILSGIGKTKDEFWAALEAGKMGHAPTEVFDASEMHTNIVVEVKDFDAKEYFGPKGLRSLDRSTKLLVAASKLAMAEINFEITDENTDDVGVSVGTTLGSLKSISEFDEVTLKDGPRYTNPSLFPNTVINSPASQVSIWNNIQGFNTTISTGFTASTDALSYAYDFIKLERAKLILAGGVEEMCYHTFFGFHELKFLSGAKEGVTHVNCPFDKRRNGITFGEGAVLLGVEELEHAKERKASILGEILGFGSCFDPFRIHKYNPRGTGVKEVMRLALKDANLTTEDIDCIFANANSTQPADKIETEAIKDVFGARAYKIPVTAIKSMIGETFSVSGAMAAAAALGAINKGFIPPTVNYKEKDPVCDLDYVPNKSRKADLDKVMILTFGPSGNSTCMIVGRYHS